MATMTVSLPDPMKDWIETLTRKGEYASSSDYVRDLVRRDRERRDSERRGQDMTLEELRQLVADAKGSGISTRSVEDIFQEARKIVRARSGDVSE
jgi:antitoxin ParD1/3/4